MPNKIIPALIFALLIYTSAIAHPTGNLITVNGVAYWSYVCPLNDPAHHGCVMRWDEQNGVTQWLTSEYPSSDWMMYATGQGGIYLIERYYDNAIQKNMVRMFFWNGSGEPEEIRPWFRDENRIGEAGFFVLDDGRVVYARHPSIYVLNDDGTSDVWLDWHEPVAEIRYIDDEHLLIRSGESAWLTTYDGTIINEWNDLIEPLDGEAPFMGNIIFDADYTDGGLYLAYWGKRRFDVISDVLRETIVSYQSPWIPHAVAAEGNTVYMLTSTLYPEPNQRINPSLLRMHDDQIELLWGESAYTTDVGYNIHQQPSEYELYQNYPNPFNNRTTIKYSLAKPANVNINIYSCTGEKVTTLHSGNETQGKKAVTWNGKDSEGNEVSSGVYFFELQTGGYSQSKKMLFMK